MTQAITITNTSTHLNEDYSVQCNAVPGVPSPTLTDLEPGQSVTFHPDKPEQPMVIEAIPMCPVAPVDPADPEGTLAALEPEAVHRWGTQCFVEAVAGWAHINQLGEITTHMHRHDKHGEAADGYTVAPGMTIVWDIPDRRDAGLELAATPEAVLQAVLDRLAFVQKSPKANKAIHDAMTAIRIALGALQGLNPHRTVHDLLTVVPAEVDGVD